MNPGPRYRAMTGFTSFADLRAACLDLPAGDDLAAATAARRDAFLTKPPGSLGLLEDVVVWLARWQGRAMPRLDRVEVLVFAGNHGVVAQGVSAYPAAVTAQMVANFAAGGAAINQLAAAAAAIAAALFGGGGERWAGRGTGVDDQGLARKRAAIDTALTRHRPLLGDPLQVAAAFGGRELAAILGATLAARRQNIPVLIDGFVCTAAVAPLAKLGAGTLAHTWASHVSTEAAHRALLDALGLTPLLDLRMRLGEASGAAVATLILRAALACHAGMATFAEAGVSNKLPTPSP